MKPKICPDCGCEFTPTPDNEVFCTRCNALFEIAVEEAGDNAPDWIEDEE